MTDADREEIQTRTDYESQQIAAKLEPTIRKHTWLSSITSSAIVGLVVWLGCRAQIAMLSQDLNYRIDRIEKSLPGNVQSNQQQVILQRAPTREEVIGSRVALYASKSKKGE